MCPSHILFLVSFQTFSLSISPHDLEYFLAHLALLQDTVLPGRADCAIRLEMNLEARLKATHMINEEQITLLLCGRRMHLSLIQESDNGNGRDY